MTYISTFEQEGEVRGLKDGIALALKIKFGEAGRQSAAEVRQISDLEILRRVMASIETAASVDEIRELWAE